MEGLGDALRAAIPPLDLDVQLLDLESPQRFEHLCSLLAKREFPRCYLMSGAGSWDEGRDVALFRYLVDYRASKKGGKRGSKAEGDIVWQCKFVRHLDASTKRSIKHSIETVRDHGHVPVTRWILCLPVDPTGPFIRWLRQEIEPRGWRWEIWGRKELLEKLARHSDLVEMFFYPIYEKLRRHFAVDQLELFQLALDEGCQWRQEPGALWFARRGNVVDADLVFDLIVRNSGRVDGVLVGIEVVVADRESNLHGLPDEGLLFPKITYCVSINGGQPGRHHVRCEPPLIVRAASVERFKIRLTDTGYAWKGNLRIMLDYGKGRLLPLPTMRLYT